MARLELALPMAGLLLAACAPAPTRLTDAQLDDYAAGLKRAPASTPTPEPTKIPALPTPQRGDVPRLQSGGAPPELTPTIALTLPDGTKATATIPPPTPIPATATPDKVVRVESIAEKSPLPRYGAFTGDLLNAKTKAREGLLMLASIPQPKGPDKLFLWDFRQYAPDFRGWGFDLFSVGKDADGDELVYGDKEIVLNISPKGIGGRPQKIQLALGNNGKSLSGEYFEGAGGAIHEDWRATFQLTFTGSGKATVIETLKRTKLAGLDFERPTNARWEGVNIADVDKAVNLSQWPD